VRRQAHAGLLALLLSAFIGLYLLLSAVQILAFCLASNLVNPVNPVKSL